MTIFGDLIIEAIEGYFFIDIFIPINHEGYKYAQELLILLLSHICILIGEGDR